MPENEAEIKENKARIEMLDKRIDAITKILVKEGITTKEEVEESTKELIGGKDE
jgi:hypothetical protein